MKPELTLEYGALSKLRDVLKQTGSQSALVVTGKASFAGCGAKAEFDKLEGEFKFTYFNDFSINPKIEEAQKGIELFEQLETNVVIAVGGGSVIDMAKIIVALSKQASKDYPDLVKSSSQLVDNNVNFIAIPTTAGTGSETTHFAVVYIEGVKYSLARPYLLPDHAIVDPSLTLHLPESIAAETAFDALCQATESYWATGSTEESKGYAKEAIEALLPNMVKGVKEKNKEAKLALAKGAHLAGKAINISKTTAPHAISYPITTKFGVPHGHAVALTLGKFFELNSTSADLNDKRGKDYLATTMNELFEIYGVKTAKEAENNWHSLMKEVGLEPNMKKVGIRDKEDIEYITSKINLERLGNHPIKMTRNGFDKIFGELLKKNIKPDNIDC